MRVGVSGPSLEAEDAGRCMTRVTALLDEKQGMESLL